MNLIILSESYRNIINNCSILLVAVIVIVVSVILASLVVVIVVVIYVLKSSISSIQLLVRVSHPDSLYPNGCLVIFT